MDHPCTYCGDIADTEDHLEPVSRQTSRRRKGKMASCGKRVPCCLLCNSLLGACDVFTVRERAMFLAFCYARRDRKNPLVVLDKMQHLLHVAAGFPLPEEIEVIIEAEARRIEAIAEAERLRVRQAFEEAERADAEEAKREYDRALRQRIAKAKAAARTGELWHEAGGPIVPEREIVSYVGDIDLKGRAARAGLPIGRPSKPDKATKFAKIEMWKLKLER
jgi:hypothetical protein